MNNVDSEATDDEEDSGVNYQIENPKRIVREILVPCTITKCLENSPQQYCEKIMEDPTPSSSKIKRKTTSIFKCVCQRKWGKYTVEIQYPFRGTRLWLGTFDSE